MLRKYVRGEYLGSATKIFGAEGAKRGGIKNFALKAPKMGGSY